jgi:phospholipid/cholesterol/gamma-HCH transport system permease protein
VIEPGSPLTSVPPPSPGAIAGVGRSVIDSGRGMRALWLTLRAAYMASRAPGDGARDVCRGIAVRQIFYTSVQGLGLVSVVALFIGATLVMQTEIMGGAVHREIVGRVLVAVVMRELAPLITAVLVAGRSGTAIATELGVMRVGGEVMGLSSLGIDPPRILVWPRLVAAVVSMPVLTVFFSAVAVFGGVLAALVMGAHGLGDLEMGLTEALVPVDLPLFLLKSIGLGCIVGLLACHYGLQVSSSPTEVPIKASRAVVRTLLACVIYNTIVTVAFYWWMGSPLR